MGWIEPILPRILPRIGARYDAAMLLRTKPLDQLTAGEHAEYFANELTVRHNRGEPFAKSIAVAYAKLYQGRGIEPERAAGIWVQEFGTPPTAPPASPAGPPARVKADKGMGEQNRAGEIEVVKEAMRRPVTKRKDKR